MRSLIIYSSVTGNTRLVAEGIATALPGTVELYPVHKAPSSVGYDLVLLGFWVYKAKPDLRMLRYMQTIHKQQVALFGTLAAWPDSPHAQTVLTNARNVLEDNSIVGEFLCLGKLSSKRFAECITPTYVSPSHPMTPERKARLMEGQTHPNASDITRAAEMFRQVALQLHV